MVITDDRQWAKAFAHSFMADLSRNPNIAGSARELRGKILNDLAREARREAGPILFPNLRAFLRTEMNVEEHRLASGMGQWAALIGSVTEAAGTFFSQREQIKAQEKIAEIQLKAKQAELRQQELAAERERQMLAASQGVPSAAVSPSEKGGLPTWALPVGAAAGAAIVTKVAGVW